MEPKQAEEILKRLSDLSETLESISDKLGIIANSLVQLADKHGSKTPGPFV